MRLFIEVSAFLRKTYMCGVKGEGGSICEMMIAEDEFRARITAHYVSGTI